VNEYEESGGRFKINGYFYNFSYESKTKYKYFVCNKSRCTIRCRGSITISPDSKIVKKIEHTCNTPRNEIDSSITTREKTERELRGKKTLIYGHFYHFRHESIKKNKYYVCSKRNCPIKCHGSITIAPNSQVIKRVEHICNTSKN
jgi:acetyltransferase-like isoleucine patch superfamily enzyme